MDSRSPELPHDAATASRDYGDLMQHVAPATVEQSSDPWLVPEGYPWTQPHRPVNATRSHLPQIYDAQHFRPRDMDIFDPVRTLSRPDLAIPEVPGSGLGRPSVYAGGGPTGEREGPAPRFALDTPPQWDGKNPQTQPEPCFKKLQGWLLISRTLKTQQGLRILSSCTSRSNLELIINELSLETRIRENGGKIVYDHIYQAYKEYIELSMIKHLDRALYSQDCKRKRGETLMSYTARGQIPFPPLRQTLAFYYPKMPRGTFSCETPRSQPQLGIPLPLTPRIRTITT